MQPRSHLLRPDTLNAFGNLELLARSVVEGMLLGLHRSPVFGFSQEFAEYRAYRDGDDPRHVDWNVFARSERMVIKQFRGDTNSHLMIVLDASASMNFGTPTSKLDYARMLAACLAFLASRQHDAPGLTVFDETVLKYLAPSRRPGAQNALLATLENLEPGQGTRFQPALESFLGRVGRRGMVAVISDFHRDPEILLERVQPLCLAGHDLILFQVLDAEELRPRARGPRLLKDLETGEAVEVSPDFLARDYPERIQRHVDELATAAGKAGGHHLLLETQQPLGPALRDYLKFRQHRR